MPIPISIMTIYLRGFLISNTYLELRQIHYPVVMLLHSDDKIQAVLHISP